MRAGHYPPPSSKSGDTVATSTMKAQGLTWIALLREIASMAQAPLLLNMKSLSPPVGVGN